LLPLVDEEVGDDRRPRRPQPPARRPVAGLQRLEFLAARRGGEQGLQLLLPLLEGFWLSHRHPFGHRAGGATSPCAFFSDRGAAVLLLVPGAAGPTLRGGAAVSPGRRRPVSAPRGRLPGPSAPPGPGG